MCRDLMAKLGTNLPNQIDGFGRFLESECYPFARFVMLSIGVLKGFHGVAVVVQKIHGYIDSLVAPLYYFLGTGTGAGVFVEKGGQIHYVGIDDDPQSVAVWIVVGANVLQTENSF